MFKCSKKISLLFFLLCIGCKNENVSYEEIETQTDFYSTKYYTGFFEGSEPFWNLKIDSNHYILYCDNQEQIGQLYFSKESNRGQSIGFGHDNFHGIINKTSGDYCYLAITEEDSLAYEIYYTFQSQTYRGCGTISQY